MNTLRYYFTFLVLFGIILIGCASTAPLPATLNIVPPAPDVPPEIAAFSGVWKGVWDGALDGILVVEKIDTKTAEIIISLGDSGGYEIRPQNRYWYATAKVIPGPAIEWQPSDVNIWTFKMDKGLNKIYGEFDDRQKGNWGKKWIYLYKRESQ